MMFLPTEPHIKKLLEEQALRKQIRQEVNEIYAERDKEQMSYKDALLESVKDYIASNGKRCIVVWERKKDKKMGLEFKCTLFDDIDINEVVTHLSSCDSTGNDREGYNTCVDIVMSGRYDGKMISVRANQKIIDEYQVILSDALRQSGKALTQQHAWSLTN